MFQLFGFPVHVRTGFVVFLGLIVFLYQSEYGLWLAAGLAAFTLLHELGHAVAARSAGAEAHISLSFLAGYTSFRSPAGRPIGRGRRAVISAAGPAVQIVAGLAVLLALGIDPTDEASVRSSAIGLAVFWSGPVIGALNLIPVLPLDGGHLLETGIEAATDKDATRTMAILSLVLTVGFAVWMAMTGRTGFVILIAFLVINQLQILGATSDRQSPGDPLQQMVAAETKAWQTGTPGPMALGQQLSPWFDAYRAVDKGKPGAAERFILDDLRSTGERRWIAPAGATREQLKSVLNVLDDPLPDGNPQSQQALVEVLLASGDYQRAGRYAVQSFQAHGSAQLAVAVARAAAATGDSSNAIAWVSAAIDRAVAEGENSMRRLAAVLDQAPELASVRSDTDVILQRHRLS